MPKQEVVSIQAHGRCIQNYYKTSCYYIIRAQRIYQALSICNMLLFTDTFHPPILHEQEQFIKIHRGLSFSLSLTWRFCAALYVIQGFMHGFQVNVVRRDSDASCRLPTQTQTHTAIRTSTGTSKNMNPQYFMI